MKEGDIVGLDGGVKHKGMISDSAVTVAVGKISDADQELMDVTKKALMAGIHAAVGGNYVNDISKAIEIDSTIGLCFYNRGYLYYQFNEPEKACAEWQKGIERNDQDSKIAFEKYCKGHKV